jgi:hypothetical protein
MFKLDRKRIIVLLLFVSLIIFAALIVAKADLVFTYITLVFMLALMLVGVFAYEVEEQV